MRSVEGASHLYNSHSKTTPLQQAGANARLDNGRIQDSNGEVTTIRVWIQRKIAEGFAPTMVLVPDTATVNRLEKELAYLRKQWEPNGNPNWPSTKRFTRSNNCWPKGL